MKAWARCPCWLQDVHAFTRLPSVAGGSPQNTEPEDSRDNEGLGDLIALIRTCPFICRGKGSFGSPGKLMLEPMVVRQLLTGLKSG